MPRENEKPTRPEVRAYTKAVLIDFREAAIFQAMIRDAAMRDQMARAGAGGLK
jgi:predicted RNA methylase